MKKLLLVFAILLAPAMAQTTTAVRCFYQNGVTNLSQSYWGNSVTHDNVHAPTSQTTFRKYGNNAFISDGPVSHVGTPCILTSVTYKSGPSPNVDPYHQHFVCCCTAAQGCTGSGGCKSGSGSLNWQGDTDVSTPPAKAGNKCVSPDSDVGFTNTYDVGLYCASPTGSTSSGECTYGQLYCSIGPVPYNVASPRPGAIVTFNCIQNGPQGYVVLPPGDYLVNMGTNCDDGSVPAPGGVGATAGAGDLRCLTGQGEGGPFGYGAGTLTGTYKSATQLYAWKYFVFPKGTGQPKDGHCLLYDPYHDNTIGLPPTLTSYDDGNCTLVDGTNGVELNPQGRAPHSLGFTWWSNL